MTAAEEEVFLVRLESHKNLIYKVCNTYCASPGDRNDLAQEILIELWKAFEKYDKQFKFSTWMYRIALNVAISFYRKQSSRSRHTITIPEEQLFEVQDESLCPAANEDQQLLYSAIAQFEPFDKALVLLYLEGHDHKQISEILGISVSNVGTRMNRIKNRLRQQFAGLQNS